MRRSFAALLALALYGPACGPAMAEPPAHYPERTILLLVASWCAPCRGEIARIEEIATAARPFAVRVLLVDDTRASQRMIAALPATRRWSPDPDHVAAVRAGLLARTPGLPYSVAFDRQGRLCADRRGGLNPEQAKLIVARCLTPP
ncbi:TlpA family protein disulfide reductase [Sphingomonas radiodurans]|uniref:TlpA family protein disulfide reductase n=1 Tax=Sphingomonas radiodurans TaxID=2890321 RepID=UPI001E3EB7EA|nr:hypothetical protein [Sphingomonas radiodurans]WBH17873.1 hypothetical protein LLW23_07185 [Sphingomonas radiodurans]